MKISVIIPSYQGELKLPNILENLAFQTFKNFEVIIAIDGSSDDSVMVAKNQIKKWGLNGKVFFVSNRGRAAIRNFGATKSNCEILLFFDDDMRPKPTCIEAHLNNHLKYANSIIVGSQIENKEDLKTDIHQYKYYLSNKWQFKERFLELNYPFITAANMSISKYLFEEMNGFNEGLTDAEDFEFACRAFKKDIKIFFDKKCEAYHDDFIIFQTYINRQKEYKIANAIVHDLHPEYSRSTIKVNLLKSILMKFMAEPFFVKWIDKGYLTFLPQTLRYKCYDFILTSHIETKL